MIFHKLNNWYFTKQIIKRFQIKMDYLSNKYFQDIWPTKYVYFTVHSFLDF